MKQQKATQVEAALKKLGTKKKAEASAWFFKTGKGEYAEGDKFYGVTVPEQRKVAKDFRELSLVELSKLLKSSMHESRLTALFILVWQFEHADAKLEKAIYDLYLKHTKYINNWDLVDSSAPQIIGGYLKDKNRAVLQKLARSKDLWERRIAMLATYYFIRMQTDFSDALVIATILLKDEHDLIHKAVGWMLREIGNRDLKTEEAFLNTYAKEMPRTMLRYAIEKFPKSKREKYMKA